MRLAMVYNLSPCSSHFHCVHMQGLVTKRPRCCLWNGPVDPDQCCCPGSAPWAVGLVPAVATRASANGSECSHGEKSTRLLLVNPHIWRTLQCVRLHSDHWLLIQRVDYNPLITDRWSRESTMILRSPSKQDDLVNVPVQQSLSYFTNQPEL